MNRKYQYRTASGVIVSRQGYPWEPDLPEPETELVFSHADLRHEDGCGGDFRESLEGIFKCDECQMIMTEMELIALAEEAYDGWERQCVRELHEQEPYYI